MNPTQYFFLELKKLYHFPTFRKAAYFAWGVAGLLAVSPVFVKSLLSLNWSELFLDAFQLGMFVTNLGMIVTAAQFVASEYENKTINLTMSHGISRKLFLGGKALALIVGTYAIVLGISFVALVISAILAIIQGNFYIGDLSFLHLASTLLFAPLKIFPMMVISFLLTTYWRTSIFPIAFLIFYAALGEFLVVVLLRGTRFETISPYLPERIIQSIDSITTYHLSNSLSFTTLDRINEASASLLLTPWQSAIGIFAYAAIALWLSYITLSRQDL